MSEFKHNASGYTNHNCRCDVCREGFRILQMASKRKRYAATEANGGIAPGNRKHGKPSTRTNWGCRCDECRVAYNADQLARYYKRKADR